jgi:CRP/FNR family transcriptional regulator, cyclic AMP receptor protein
MDFGALDLIRVFEYEPDLLQGLDERAAAHLRRRMTVRRSWADPGPWTPDPPDDAEQGHLGLLVIDGLLTRTVRLGGRECSEVVGPGDLIRPWDSEEWMSVECGSAWRVLVPTTFAGLDRGFALRAARWPTIMAQLLGRSTRRCRMLVYQATIAHIRHADTRVLLALWHLADRWGKVTADGVLVPVPLTHQLLAQITCLQRPTVSAAVGHLRQSGRISRAPEGGWLLHGAPPDPSLLDRHAAATARPPTPVVPSDDDANVSGLGSRSQ